MNQRDVASVIVGGNRVNLRPSLPEADIAGVPFVTVSSKGLSDGTSDKINGGRMFGKDTPGTQTTGIQEAIDYAISIGEYTIGLDCGVYYLNKGVTINVANTSLPGPQFNIVGITMMATYIVANTNDDMFTVNSTTPVNVNAQISMRDFQPAAGAGFTPNSFLKWIVPSGSLIAQTLVLDHIDIANGTWGTSPLAVNGIKQIFLYEYECYSADFNAAQILNVNDVYVFGSGINGYIELNNVLSCHMAGAAGIQLYITGIVHVLSLNGCRLTSVNISGGTITSMHLEDIYYETNATNILFASSAATIKRLTMKNVGFYLTGTANIPFVSANITIDSVKLDNVFNLASSPYSVTGFPVNNPAAPAVPASGSGYTNTLLYDVYIIPLTASGVTYTITDIAGNVSASIPASAGSNILLKAGETITPTYTTLTWTVRSAE